jgi:hypothetical protein
MSLKALPRRAGVALTVLTSLLLPGLGWTGTAAAVEEAPWFPESGAYVGAAVGKQADDALPTCRDVNAQAGRSAFEGAFCTGQFAYIDRVFHRWDASTGGAPWPTPYDTWSRDRGRRLLISWNSTRADGSRTLWKDIAAGREDARIDQQAERIKAFGARIYLAFDHEPEVNGAAGKSGTPAEFRAAWRRIVDRFRARGVTNVKWTLILMGWTFNPASGRNPDHYYNGPAYVDAIGVNAYNWYGCSGAKNQWASFGQLYQRGYDWATARGLPVVAAEFGSVEDPLDPERKGEWLGDATEWVAGHPNMKVLSYFNLHDFQPERNRNCDWTVDSSLRSLVAYRSFAQELTFP